MKRIINASLLEWVSYDKWLLIFYYKDWAEVALSYTTSDIDRDMKGFWEQIAESWFIYLS